MQLKLFLRVPAATIELLTIFVYLKLLTIIVQLCEIYCNWTPIRREVAVVVLLLLASFSQCQLPVNQNRLHVKLCLLRDAGPTAFKPPFWQCNFVPALWQHLFSLGVYRIPELGHWGGDWVHPFVCADFFGTFFGRHNEQHENCCLVLWRALNK